MNANRGVPKRWRVAPCGAALGLVTSGCVLLVLLAGCATATTTRSPGESLLDFLEDGKTSREMVIRRLGGPARTFEGGRILTYRMAERKTGQYYPRKLDFVRDEVGKPSSTRPNWDGTTFSLVLIFDERNVLQKHSLVQVWTP